MSCMCLQSLRRTLESLKNLPLKALTGLIPKGLVYSPDLTQLSQQSAAVISARAFASARVSAQISAALKLSLPKVPIGLPKLLALAQISGTGGINMAMGSRLSIMSNSIRLNAPAITPMIAELLDPFMDALMELMALASAISSANTALGINLMQPGALARLPVSVSLSQGISVNETLKANLGAAAGLGDLGLMMSAASTLGINLGSPGGVAKLAMLIKATAAMPIPKIDIPPELLKLSSAMAALNSVSSASGINLMTSVSLNPLRAALNALMANLDVLKLESVNAASISSVNQLNAVLPAVGVNFRPLASINFTGIKLSALPDLSSLSQVATLSWQLNNGAGINLLPSRPCGGACPVSGAALM